MGQKTNNLIRMDNLLLHFDSPLYYVIVKLMINSTVLQVINIPIVNFLFSDIVCTRFSQDDFTPLLSTSEWLTNKIIEEERKFTLKLFILF